MSEVFKTIIVRNPFVDELERFEKLARECKQAGVTHLTFTEVEPSLWEIDDPLDPYLHWSVVHTSLFKLFPPAILQDWVPADYASRQRELISAKAVILKKIGLKGAAFLYDPIYWPESVFKKYPHLRGPRVDAPHSCVHPRYSPCIDHPEVLDMYYSGFRQLQELSLDVFDIVIVRTNDSGTGFCWSNLYNGANGPLKCKNTTHLARTGTFLEKCMEGLAIKGEAKARIYLGGGAIGGQTPLELSQKLPEGSGYYSHSKRNIGGDRILSGFLAKFSMFPIRGIPNPVEILGQLSTAFEKDWPEIVLFTCPSIFGHDWEGDVPILKVIEQFNKTPCVRMMGKIAFLKKVASELYGEDNADDVVEAWWNIHDASEILSKSTIGMANLIFWGSIAQRWLTRPLVVFPERLKEDDKKYYKPYLFQANQAHENHDLLDQEPLRNYDGVKHLNYFNRHFDDAFCRYKQARDRIREVYCRGNKQDEELKKQLTSFEILFCILRNIRNCINFQIQIELLRNKHQLVSPNGYDEVWSDLAASKLLISDILRSDMDNALRLAEILENEGGIECFTTSADKAGETPLMFGPDIINALKFKVEVMQARVTEIDEMVGFRELLISEEN